MERNTITEWLNTGKDYDIGVALYQVHGSDDSLKEMFSQGYSDYRAKRLEAELRAVRSNAVVVPPAEEKPPVMTITVKEEALPENQVKEEEDPYRSEWIPLYQRLNYLRHNLRSAADDDERGVMAFEILDLERQCMRIWYRRDYWRKYNEHLPEQEATTQPVADKNELHRWLCNARANLSKATTKLLSDPEDNKAKSRKKKWEAAVREIELKLKQYA